MRGAHRLLAFFFNDCFFATPFAFAPPHRQMSQDAHVANVFFESGVGRSSLVETLLLLDLWPGVEYEGVTVSGPSNEALLALQVIPSVRKVTLEERPLDDSSPPPPPMTLPGKTPPSQDCFAVVLLEDDANKAIVRQMLVLWPSLALNHACLGGFNVSGPSNDALLALQSIPGIRKVALDVPLEQPSLY